MRIFVYYICLCGDPTYVVVPTWQKNNNSVKVEMEKLLVLVVLLLLFESVTEHSEENPFSITISETFVKSNTKCTSHCIHDKDDIIFKSKISIGNVDDYVDRIKYETKTKGGTYETLCYVNVLKCSGYKHSICYCTKSDKRNVFDVVLNVTAQTFYSEAILRAQTVYRNKNIASNDIFFPRIYNLNTIHPSIYIENYLLNNTSGVAFVNKEHCALGVIMKDVDNGFPYRLQFTDTSSGNTTMIEDQPLIMSLHVTDTQNLTLIYDPCHATEFRKMYNFQVQPEIIQNSTVDNVTVQTSSMFIPTELSIVSISLNVLYILVYLLNRYVWKHLKNPCKKEKEQISTVHENNSHCSIGVNTDINVEDNIISEDQRPVEEALIPTEQISIVNEDERHSLIGINANTNDEDNNGFSGEEEKEALIPTEEFKHFTNPNDHLTCISVERNVMTNSYNDAFRTTELFTNQSPQDYEMKLVSRDTSENTNN
ncbi:hypothetical protein BgiMline_031654 [Biomphalaria glabrata]